MRSLSLVPWVWVRDRSDPAVFSNGPAIWPAHQGPSHHGHRIMAKLKR